MNMDPALEKYVLSHSDEEDQLLCELSRQTHLKYVNPRMVAGHLQGKILEMISKMIRPSTILEIGTFTGYSTICLAKGLTGEGIMHTIEINDELEDFTTSWFVKAGLADKIKLHLGDALSLIPQLNYSFDLVFIDGEKNEY
ncbi:MAG: class I SAM-dependent methyltransferase, partial [Bacteroidota bacterium]|nr:class I SAM-dependent methyltransferase [Bacteroidota bacterium]